MVRQTARVLIFELLGGVLFLAVIAAAILAWRLSQGPLELDMYRDDIARALTEARGGRAVEIEKVQLQWSPARRRVDVLAQGITFYAQDGARGGYAAEADLELDASGLLLGRVDVVEVGLRDAEVEVRQVAPDVWSIASEPLPAIPAAEFPETPADWLASINRVLAALLVGGEDAFDDLMLSRVSFQGLDVDVVGLSGARIARVADAAGALEVSGGDLSLTLSGLGEGDGLPERIALGLDSFGQFETLNVQVQVAGWTLSELAGRMGAAPGRLAGLPAELTLSFQATTTGGLSSVAAQVETGPGRLSLADEMVEVTEIVGEANYDTGTDTLDFAFSSLDAGLARGPVNGSLGGAVFAAGPRPVSLRAPQLAVDARPLFERPWSLQNVEVDARIAPGADGVEIDRLRFDTRGITMAIAGRVARADPGSDGRLPVTANLAANVSGATGVRTVLDFWPPRLGAGARRFVARNIEAAELTGATARLTLRPDSFAAGHLRDGDLNVDFSVRGADVRFLSEVAAITGASGTGRLTGNSFSVAVNEAQWLSWDITSGSVAIPQLNPRGGDLIIEAAGRGPVEEAVTAVFRSRLDLEARTGFDPTRLSGEGDMVFRMVRPALDRVAPEDVSFSVEGRVMEAGVTGLAAGYDLTDASARVALDGQGIAINGRGALGPAPVTFDWRDEFDDDNTPSRLAAQSVVTPDVLNRFGLPGRPYITGEVPVELTASVQRDTVVEAAADLDFTAARIDLTEVGWRKPPADPATASIVYTDYGGLRSARAALDSEGAKLEGQVRLAPTGRLIDADLTRAFLEGRMDVSGRLSRGANGSLDIEVNGPLLDVSGVLPSPGGVAGGSALGAVTLDAEVDTLVLGEALVLRGARLGAVSRATGLDSFSASGALGAGTGLEASYQRIDEGSAQVSLSSDDAGALVETFFDSDLLRGGRLDLQGVVRQAEETSSFDIRVEDARLRDAPFLTQILSLASLRGLADTLGGEGVLFSEISLPLRARAGRYVVDGGRASGPAMGVTVNGWVEPEAGGLAVDGVLVPSYGVNSALGGVPIIGDLFVGREGEGVFSLTYSVRGELARAQVTVNPLSAITPGVLRRIFENPSQTELPTSEPAPVGE
ncbi:MAG: AsmA-like C-terminal region-containing protein [Pseudomonadota bacterium]